jgi:hypothetical protein
MQKHQKNLTEPAGTSDDTAGTVPAGSTRRKRVERRTYLRGQAINPPRYPDGAVRRQTGKDLAEDDADIPYTAWERATKDPVCSLKGRQDRFFRPFLLQVNDLQYRVDDLELDLEEHSERTQGMAGKVP